MKQLAWICEDCGELKTTNETSNLPQYHEETCACGGSMKWSGYMPNSLDRKDWPKAINRLNKPSP